MVRHFEDWKFIGEILFLIERKKLRNICAWNFKEFISTKGQTLHSIMRSCIAEIKLHH